MRVIAGLLLLSAAVITEPTPSRAAACEALSYGYVGYTENGTRNFVKKQLERKVNAWKDKHSAPGARVGRTQVSCKIFLKIGFFTEHECHAKTKICR